MAEVRQDFSAGRHATRRWRKPGQGFASLLIGAFAAIAVSGCGDLFPGFGGDDSQSARFSASLPDFDSTVLNGYEPCTDLSDDLESAGQLIANQVIDQGSEGFFDEPELTLDAVPTDAGGETSFETNVQVEGVDEADIVKSDGQFIFLAHGGDLVVVNLEGAILSRIEVFTSRPIAALLLEAGRLLAISGSDFYSFAGLDSVTQLALFSVSAEGALTELERGETPGAFVEGRSIAGQVHIVGWADLETDSELFYPLYRYQSEFEGMSDKEYEQAAFEKAQTLIPAWRDRVVETLVGANVEQAGEGECRNVMKISRLRARNAAGGEETKSDPAVLDDGIVRTFLQVTSFDMGQGLGTLYKAGAFVPGGYGYGLNVYADPELLVVSSDGWFQDENGGWSNSTFLFAFSYLEGAAVPSAVGSVDGRLPNQFAMDYYQNHLRVATNVDARWGQDASGAWREDSPTESIVTILAINAEQLERVGQVRGLGQGESLFAVRFLEDRAFVVTFLRTDPFYTLDLSDPANPVEVGELEIPGFSNYLHPIGEDLVLAIGQDADPLTGQATAFQVSLFDVSDMTAPTLVQRYTGEEWSSSEAQWDFRAFRYLPESGILIVPLGWWRWDDTAQAESFFDGFALYSVSAADGIAVLGEVSHTDALSDSFFCGISYLAPRSMVFDGRLVTIKNSKILANQLPELTSVWGLELDDGGATQDQCFFEG